MRARRQAILAILLGGLALMLLACSGPTVPGRWQMDGNPEAGIEFRNGGQFQGELGPAGARRVRLEGTWVANGAEVTLTVGGDLAKVAPDLKLLGKIQGDTMTINPPANAPGLTGTVTLKRQPDRR